MPKHVKDSESSSVLCKFRTGNAGLGNCNPLDGRTSPMKFCALCMGPQSRHSLNEYHVVFHCTKLKSCQLDLGLLKYKRQNKKAKESLLHSYLGGDGCSVDVLLNRAVALTKILDSYMKEVKHVRDKG